MSRFAARRPRCRDRGAVLIEFSLVFILFAFICYALVVFGLALNLKSNLTHAASEGARAAVGAGGGCDITHPTGPQTKEDEAPAPGQEAPSGQSQEVHQIAQIGSQPAHCDR